MPTESIEMTSSSESPEFRLEELREASFRPYLKEGVKPIRFCVGTAHHFETEERKVGDFSRGESGKPHRINHVGAHFVNFYDEPEEMKIKGMLNSGSMTYVISPVDSDDKFSTEYFNCTGIIASGVRLSGDKKGERISLLSHQSPVEVLKKQDEFRKHLTASLEELKVKSEPGTIDAVGFGGNYLESAVKSDGNYKQDYLDMTKIIASVVKDILGFDIDIIDGPKPVSGYEDFYFSTQQNIGYVEISGVPERGIQVPYNILEIEEKKREWDKKLQEIKEERASRF